MERIRSMGYANHYMPESSAKRPRWWPVYLIGILAAVLVAGLLYLGVGPGAHGRFRGSDRSRCNG